MIINTDTRTAYWSGPGTTGSFRPNGRLMIHGTSEAIENPRAWSGDKPLWSARIFVGFNVGSKPKWHIDDLVRVIKKVRKKQGKDPDSSFLFQKGIYTSRKTGETITEDGAQVVFLNTHNEPVADFQADMESLAESICTTLKQEEVILELQRGGIVKKTFGIIPP